jgi:hypothetical protein
MSWVTRKTAKEGKHRALSFLRHGVPNIALVSEPGYDHVYLHQMRRDQKVKRLAAVRRFINTEETWNRAAELGSLESPAANQLAKRDDPAYAGSSLSGVGN